MSPLRREDIGMSMARRNAVEEHRVVGLLSNGKAKVKIAYRLINLKRLKRCP